MKIRFYSISLIILLLLAMTSCSTEKYYNEWVEKEGNYYYYDENGDKIKDTIKKIDDEMYYFDNSGKMLTGWQKNKTNESLYFLDNGKMVKGWNKIADDWYYFDANGIMKTGWVEDNNNWYYCNDNGQMARGEWTNDDYYVDDAGIMRKGLGNGYVSCVTTANDISFNLDLNEVEYGSAIDFCFMRKYANNDEAIVIEKINPNGQITKENFNWSSNHNIIRTQIQNCNIAGIWIERIYDERNNLLAENSVVVKPNPNPTISSQNTQNNKRIPIKQRVEAANFNDDYIKSMLEILVDYKNEIDYGDSNLKSFYFNQLFGVRETLVDLLNAYRLNGMNENDIRLAEEFMRELGLKSK